MIQMLADPEKKTKNNQMNAELMLFQFEEVMQKQ